MNRKISGFLISYNNVNIVETALRSIRFVDQLVVVDKSSTDGSADICKRYADEFLSVPWSPVVENTREIAFQMCNNDLILFIDDDECLTPEAIGFLVGQRNHLQADVVAFPIRHYILGRHSDKSYYWPEYRHSFFCRGAIEFGTTVHAGVKLKSDSILKLPENSPCFIHHLSHSSASVWLEKTNRYTSQNDRSHDYSIEEDISEYARLRLNYWLSKLKTAGGKYEQVVLLLRYVYDLIDAIKVWEQQALPDGNDEFERICRQLNTEFDTLSDDFGIITKKLPANND